MYLYENGASSAAEVIGVPFFGPIFDVYISKTQLKMLQIYDDIEDLSVLSILPFDFLLLYHVFAVIKVALTNQILGVNARANSGTLQGFVRRSASDA